MRSCSDHNAEQLRSKCEATPVRIRTVPLKCIKLTHPSRWDTVFQRAYIDMPSEEVLRHAVHRMRIHDPFVRVDNALG